MSNRKYCYELACDLGLAESAILSQFYYWLSNYAKKPEKYRDNFRDGRWWVHNSLRTWHSEQFNFMSFSTFTDSRTGKKGKLEKLRDAGYLVKSEKDYNKRFRGKDKDKPNKKNTSWYTLNLKKLHRDFPYTVNDFPDLPIPDFADCTEIPDSDCMENPDNTIRKFQTDYTEIPDNACTEIPDTYTLDYFKNTDKNTLPKKTETEKTVIKDSDCESDEWIKSVARNYLANRNDIDEKERILPFMSLYLQTFRTRRGEEHGRVSVKTIRKAVDNLIETGAYKKPEVINKYFTCTEFTDTCDFRLAHFTSLKVLRKRLEEVEQEEKARERKEKELFSNGSEDEESEMTDEEWLAMMDDSNESTRQEQEEPHNTEQTSDNPTCTERKREPIYSVMDNKDLDIPIENDEILPFL